MCSSTSSFATEENMRHVLQWHFNLEVVKTNRMDSYYNLNFLVRCNKPDDITIGNEPYVVKIFNTKSESFFDNAELQHIMMDHLRKNDFGSSIPLRTLKGDTYVRHREGDNEYLLQVLTFVPGQSLNDAEVNPGEMKQICFESGRSLGKLHRITKRMKYDFTTSTPDFPWLPHNAKNFFEKLSYVKSEDVKKVIASYKRSYERNLLTRLGELRKGFVHSDFSDTNVIIRKNKSEEWDFSGIIDFEHCHFGYLVGELGVSIAYFMMKSASITGSDVVISSGQQIRGYCSINPLTDAEKEVLLDVVVGRLCSSYIGASCQAHKHPENEKYIFTSARNIPRVFQALENAGRKSIHQAWFGDLR